MALFQAKKPDNGKSSLSVIEFILDVHIIE